LSTEYKFLTILISPDSCLVAARQEDTSAAKELNRTNRVKSNPILRVIVTASQNALYDDAMLTTVNSSRYSKILLTLKALISLVGS
jgi:hypothetical protein